MTSLFMASVGGLAVADVRAVVHVLTGAQEFRSAGASIQVVQAPDAIDGQRCAALRTVDGVTAAGAIRDSEDTRALSLPSTAIPTYETTPGFAELLTPHTNLKGGVWLSTSLAETLGSDNPTSIATNFGSTSVAGIYPYPDDGRGQTISYAMLAPVPASGSFDACWVEIWPVNDTKAQLLRTTVLPREAGDQSVTQSQLNGRLGDNYDGTALLDARLTRHAPFAAIAAGLAIGFGAIRARRLELAAALHAGVARSAMAAQVLIETIVWATIAAMLATPILGAMAAWTNPDPSSNAWFIGMRTIVAGVGAVLVGGIAGAALTREAHLFRYFKER